MASSKPQKISSRPPPHTHTFTVGEKVHYNKPYLQECAKTTTLSLGDLYHPGTFIVREVQEIDITCNCKLRAAEGAATSPNSRVSVSDDDDGERRHETDCHFFARRRANHHQFIYLEGRGAPISGAVILPGEG